MSDGGRVLCTKKAYRGFMLASPMRTIKNLIPIKSNKSVRIENDLISYYGSLLKKGEEPNFS